MTKNQNSLDIGHKKLGISTKKGRGRITRQENAKKIGALTVDQAVDRFVGAGNLKRPPRLIFSIILLHSLKTLHILASRDHFGLDLRPFDGLGVDFGTF